MWQPIVNLAQASWESSNHGRVDEQKRHRPPTAAVRKTLSRKSEISPTRVFYPYERVLPFLCRRVAQTYLTALRYFIEIKRNVSWWAHAVDILGRVQPPPVPDVPRSALHLFSRGVRGVSPRVAKCNTSVRRSNPSSSSHRRCGSPSRTVCSVRLEDPFKSALPNPSLPYHQT